MPLLVALPRHPVNISPSFLSLSTRTPCSCLWNWFSVVSNLVRNYSPHLAPNTLSAIPTAELRKILGMAAQEMLIVFLRKNRTRRSVARGMGVGSTGHPVDVVSLYSFLEKAAEWSWGTLEGNRYRPGQIVRSIWESKGAPDPPPGTQWRVSIGGRACAPKNRAI